MGLNSEQSAKIRKFYDTIAKKTDWAIKILDPQKDLATKWVEEAGFFNNLRPDGSDSESDDRLTEEDIKEVIQYVIFFITLYGFCQLISRELKRMARRVCILDHTIRLHSTQIPAGNVPWQTIDQDVSTMLKYTLASKGGVRAANLRVKPSIGIYVSDGLVPKSLHSEVSSPL